MVKGLLHHGSKEDLDESLSTQCDQFESTLNHPGDRMNMSDFNQQSNLDLQEHPTSPVWDNFKYVQSNVVDKILEGMRLTTCELDHRPSLADSAAYTLLV